MSLRNMGGVWLFAVLRGLPAAREVGVFSKVIVKGMDLVSSHELGGLVHTRGPVGSFPARRR